MPVDETKRDEVRKIILALLVARPQASPIAVLDRDYYEAESEHIPFRKFGYADIVEFLKSMPEHFMVEWSNGCHYVYPIVSEKSKHVSSLVSRQKFDIKSRRPSRPRPMQRAIYVPPMRQRIRIPAEQLVFLIRYVKNNPNGVRMQDALSLIRKQMPHVMLTIQDMRQQLSELSHQLQLDYDMIYPVWPNNATGTTENRQSHSQACSQETLSPAPSKSQNAPRSPAATTTIQFAGEDSEGMEDCDTDTENDYIAAGCISHPKQPKTSNRFVANSAQHTNHEQNTNFNYNDSNNDIDLDEYFMSANSINDNNKTTTVKLSDISSLISDRMKSRLQELMQKHPEGIWCAELPEKFLEEYKVHLRYTDLGINSVREYVSYLPNIFFMTQKDMSDDFILYSADKRPTFPDKGIPRTEPIEIRQASHERYDKYNSTQTQCNDDAPIPPEVSPTITKKFAPDDVMNYDDSVEKISVIELQRNKEYLEVYIVEIFHPNFFWIHLRENKKRFDMFMDELDIFYHNNREKYTIPKIALKKGLNCACIFSNKWHRCIIKTVKPDFKVTVMFYDYGTLKTYAPEDVYYLHKQFSFLPIQAIPCSLYNVMPCVGNRWKKSVVDKFIDKTGETLLAATIISVDSLHNSMMVILTDTTEEEDVRINSWLVKEKLAQYGKMGDTVDMASISMYVLNNINQLPTYCFAEESLMPDSRCKATSTEETHEVPLVLPTQTLCHDNEQQRPLRPPPGFLPLVEQFGTSNVSTRSFHNNYSFGNLSNSQTPVFSDKETTTNPFLDDQQQLDLIPVEVIPTAEQAFFQIWNENLQLQMRLTGFFRDLFKPPLSKSIFDNHMSVQRRFNKILKGYEQALIPDDHQSASSMSNPANGMLVPNDVSLAQQMSHEQSSENVVRQELTSNTSTISNPFEFVNGDGDRSQNYTAFSAYGSSGSFPSNNQKQSDAFNGHLQAQPPSVSTPSIFTADWSSAANSISLNANKSENVPSMKPLSPRLPINANISNSDCNSSSFLSGTNSEFKETNPFKRLMSGEIQLLDIENKQTANNCNANFASYFVVKNPQISSQETKTEITNVNAKHNNFTTVGYVNVINDTNYTPRIVYTANPVMYNTQNKQNVNVKQSGSDIDSAKNTFLESGQRDDEVTVQSANNTASLHTRHDSPHTDEGYVTRPPTDYMLQSSPPIINSEPNYRPEINENEPLLISPQVWKQVEIPERWINSKFQNNVPLQNHNENSTIGASINLISLQNFNHDNSAKFVPQGAKGIMDPNYVFRFTGNDKERTMNTSWINQSWNMENQISAKQKHAACTFYFNSFIFQKIDSVKGVTFIFNIEDEGWILTHEFVESFTNLRLCSYLMAMLDAMNIKVIFKEIQRSEYPLQFLQLDNYPLNVSRDTNGRILSINLISLQAALRLLRKLKIVSREEIDNAFKKNHFVDGSVLPNMWALIVVYRDLRRRIEQCSKL